MTRPWFARHGLRWDPPTNPDTITHENNRAFNEGYIPRCLSVYGTPADRRFAGVWIKNDAPTPWSWWFADAGTYQRIFDAENQADVRPAWVSAAPDAWQLAVFRDDHVGVWAARHGITGDEYQAEFDARVANGMMPVVVQAGGGGSARRYSSIFAATDVPLPKRWTVTGTTTPQLAGLDGEVRQFMSAHAIRAGSLAVVRGAEILVSRGYTWAEDGYAVTQPNARFRLASVSKAFAAAAITRLVATGRLAWNTQAYPFLGITSALLPDQTPDPAVNTITVDHLVNRRSGLTHARVTESGVVRTFEPSADLRTVAARLGRTTMPTRDDLVRYMYGEAPDFPPGSQQAYSNFAFTLLTSIVERASGRGFLDFLRAEVLAPQGLSEVWVGATLLAGRLAQRGAVRQSGGRPHGSAADDEYVRAERVRHVRARKQRGHGRVGVHGAHRRALHHAARGLGRRAAHRRNPSRHVRWHDVRRAVTSRQPRLRVHVQPAGHRRRARRHHQRDRRVSELASGVSGTAATGPWRSPNPYTPDGHRSGGTE